MNKLTVSHLLGIKYLQIEDLKLIFKTASQFKEIINRPIKKVPSLRDITIANLFFENSTRTKLSFELAEKRLSADVLNMSVSQSSVSKGETLTDTVKNILAMKVDMIVIRHPHSGAAHFLANQVNNCSIINAGDGTHEHPSQALLDAYSLIEKLGNLNGKKIAILGDILHSRVALSNIYALKMLGANVKLCAPKSLIPKNIDSLGVTISDDLMYVLNWCDAVNVLRVQNERMDINYFPSSREYNQNFGINQNTLEKLRKKIIILHPGPINRGVEISSQVADSDSAIILDQVENGLAIRMAIIFLLGSQIKISS